MRKTIDNARQFDVPFLVHSKDGVKIYGRRGNGGYQLVKFDFNLPTEFNVFVDTATVKGEFLRNGRVWTELPEMYKYLMKYIKQTAHQGSGVNLNYPNTKFNKVRSTLVINKERNEVFLPSQDPWKRKLDNKV